MDVGGVIDSPVLTGRANDCVRLGKRYAPLVGDLEEMSWGPSIDRLFVVDCEPMKQGERSCCRAVAYVYIRKSFACIVVVEQLLSHRRAVLIC